MAVSAAGRDGPLRDASLLSDEQRREYTLRRQREQQEHRRRVREFALRQVANGEAVLNVAMEWGILRADLERWIDEEAAGEE